MTFGIIGGSGLYELEGLADTREISLETPFGTPSSPYVKGMLEGREVVFLARHGAGHRLLPSEIPFKANIWGMKKLGVTHLISVSAVGSLKEEIAPGHMVIPDQFIDRTYLRESTFFGRGVVAHVQFGDPVCPNLVEVLVTGGRKVGATCHGGGIYVCMEGPAFSTRAESNLYRSWGGSVIGMTNLQEAKLAREAEICFATLALATDYDCWHEREEEVTVDAIIRVMQANIETAKKILAHVVTAVPEARNCKCSNALRDAILTPKDQISAEVKQELEPIIGRYIAAG